jgi:hypothetical protein
MNRTTVGILAALGLAWLWTRMRPLTATVTTDEYYETDDYLAGSTTYPETLKNFARGIASAEGYGIPGAIPTVAHNPGDLVLPGWAPTLGSAGIAVFDSADQGWQRLYKQLSLIVRNQSNVYTLDMTIRQMSRRWTTTQQDPWAENVADYLGVSAETPLYQVLV